MTETPRRWRFQIHLSTAVVLMFIAGALTWANMYPREKIFPMEWRGSHIDYAYSERGFPFSAYRYLPAVKPKSSESNNPKAGLPEGIRMSYSMMVIDGLVAIAILFAVGLICEWRVSRRAARKAA